MNCRTIRVFGMAAALLVGGIMVHATAHAQGATQKAKAATAESTGAPSPSAEYSEMLKRLSEEVVSAAEAMPADKYGFAPTAGKFDGVRTFGSQVQHIAEANFFFFSGFGLSGAPDDAKLKALKDKDELVQALKDSFAFRAKGHRHHHTAECVHSGRGRQDEVKSCWMDDALPVALHGSLRSDGGVSAHEWHCASGKPETGAGRRRLVPLVELMRGRGAAEAAPLVSS